MRQVGFTRDHNPGRGWAEVFEVLACNPLSHYPGSNVCPPSLAILVQGHCGCFVIVKALSGPPLSRDSQASHQASLFGVSWVCVMVVTALHWEMFRSPGKKLLIYHKGKVPESPGWSILTKMILQTYSFLNSED